MYTEDLIEMYKKELKELGYDKNYWWDGNTFKDNEILANLCYILRKINEISN